MNTITIHPQSQKQVSLLKSLLEELKIKFEINAGSETNLLDWQKKEILEGIKQANAGDFFSEEESDKIIDECFK